MMKMQGLLISTGKTSVLYFLTRPMNDQYQAVMRANGQDIVLYEGKEEDCSRLVRVLCSPMVETRLMQKFDDGVTVYARFITKEVTIKHEADGDTNDIDGFFDELAKIIGDHNDKRDGSV